MSSLWVFPPGPLPTGGSGAEPETGAAVDATAAGSRSLAATVLSSKCSGILVSDLSSVAVAAPSSPPWRRSRASWALFRRLFK